MLEQLLKRIASGGIHTQSQLAHELNVSDSLLEQMLQDLERMGYLRRLGNACDSHCEHCDMAMACTIHDSGLVWTLTDKKLPS